MEVTFWICFVLIVYTYFIYPLVLFCAYVGTQVRRDWQYLTGRRNRRQEPPDNNGWPSISFIVAAYNEESCLQEKIANLRQLDYPAEKLEVIFVSDGSTDRTSEILAAAKSGGIKLIVTPQRRGKAAALNMGVAAASHEILVFSDASTLFAPDAVRQLVRHFSNPAVGVACGSLSFVGTAESAQTEGVYWKYESMLRLMEARLGATLTASGAIYAVRRKCFPRLAAETWIEDFVIPMHARCLGYRVVYDPEATAVEVAALSVSGEFARRVRLAVGSFRAFRELAQVALDPLVSVALFSHKLLRWLVPFFLIGLLLSNFFLWSNTFYRATLILQLLFYIWAGVGFLFRERMQKVRYALVGYFLLAMNVAFLVGFIRFLLRRREVAW